MGGSKNGLKPRGREFLAEMGRLRVLADVSHLNEAGFWDVCERSDLPPVASHSDCRWLCDVPRNLTREQARAIFERRGYIGINFCPEFLREGGRAAIDDVVRHMDAYMELGGEDCVGFGSDFDGISETPEGLATAADFPKVLEELAKARVYASADRKDRRAEPLPRIARDGSRPGGQIKINRKKAVPTEHSWERPFSAPRGPFQLPPHRRQAVDEAHADRLDEA